jgi:hypothetical protein
VSCVSVCPTSTATRSCPSSFLRILDDKCHPLGLRDNGLVAGPGGTNGRVPATPQTESVRRIDYFNLLRLLASRTASSSLSPFLNKRLSIMGVLMAGKPTVAIVKYGCTRAHFRSNKVV